MGGPQKRGAVQPLGSSTTSGNGTKKARTSSETAKQAWIRKQQSMKEEDEDPQMARAAVYYQLVLEDKLVSKVSIGNSYPIQ